MRDHGGSLGRAWLNFPDAPEPWVDLSTGINPHPYPVGPIPASAWTRLPEDADADALRDRAAEVYGAPGGANLADAPGTQILLPLVAGLVPPGRARVLGPTYAEHVRAARIAGHAAAEVASLDELAEADLAVLVNPNNPDGRLVAPDDLRDLARRLARRGGFLVIDEAFMDVLAPAPSLAGAIEEHPNLVVLRSFGKFFGLAGARLGFAVAAKETAALLRARLGPWAVPGPTLHVGLQALADGRWQAEMRARLAAEAARLDAVLAARGLAPSGGTSLYRFLRTPRAADIFEACGRRGIWLRRFESMPDALRIGLPPDAQGLARLDEALGSLG